MFFFAIHLSFFFAIHLSNEILFTGNTAHLYWNEHPGSCCHICLTQNRSQGAHEQSPTGINYEILYINVNGNNYFDDFESYWCFLPPCKPIREISRNDIALYCASTSCWRHQMESFNIFRVAGHLCGEFTGHRWIPSTKASDAERWCFLWSAPG